MVFLILLLKELAVIEESMISTFYNSIGKYSIEYDIPILNVMVVLAGQSPPPSPPLQSQQQDARESVWERGSCVCPVAAVVKLSS